MALDELERDIVEFMGTTREALRNLESGQKSQGERIGNLETRVTYHLESRSSNGNGWKTKGLYSGSGAAIVGLVELLRHWIAE